MEIFSKYINRFIGCFFFLIGGIPSLQAQYTTFDIVYGNNLYQRNFGSQLNTINQYRFGRPIQYMGISCSGMVKTDRGHDLSGNFIWAKHLPQVFQINDSVNGKLTGFTIGLTAGKDLFPKAKAFDFILSGGLNLGKMKLIQEQFHYLEYTNNNLHLKNMLICPKVSLMTKVYLGKYCISLNAEYMYDISSTSWNEKLLALGKPRSVEVAGFRQTGYSLSLHLGWNTPIGSRSRINTSAYYYDPSNVEPVEEEEEDE